jgi:glucose-6-phosphate isomerase
MIHIDLRRMGEPSVRDTDAALAAMTDLEAGGIANPSEGRQVGHYWLRSQALHGDAIRAMHDALDALDTDGFDTFVWCGIGGSALGPQLLADALPVTGLRPVFLDNTDPAGIDRALQGVDLARALVLMVSKSGGTKETRNAFAEVCARGVDPARQCIAVTVPGSALDRRAKDWKGMIPLWDWVGGRTSITSAVGLLAMKLMGQDWRSFLEGAAEMDGNTLGPDNPALAMAGVWLDAAPRSMVVLPYADGLQLFSKYLQQLVMESLGKDGQGLTVFGNKGSTDQHAYVQQLRDGPDDFFATFVSVMGGTRGIEVEPGVTSSDYLQAFLLGTRNALTAGGKRSLTLTVDELDAWHLGGLVALYERAVGYAATLMGINAYDQPGVEAGKKAAGEALAALAALRAGEAVNELAEDDREHLVRWLQKG